MSAPDIQADLESVRKMLKRDRVDAHVVAQRIAELHPPTDGRWIAERCPQWIDEIEAIVKHYAGKPVREAP